MNPLKMIKEFLENLKNILLDYLRSRIFPVTVLMFFLAFRSNASIRSTLSFRSRMVMNIRWISLSVPKRP